MKTKHNKDLVKAKRIIYTSIISHMYHPCRLPRICLVQWPAYRKEIISIERWHWGTNWRMWRYRTHIPCSYTSQRFLKSNNNLKKPNKDIMLTPLNSTSSRNQLKDLGHKDQGVYQQTKDKYLNCHYLVMFKEMYYAW